MILLWYLFDPLFGPYDFVSMFVSIELCLSNTKRQISNSKASLQLTDMKEVAQEQTFLIVCLVKDVRQAHSVDRLCSY